MQSIIFPALRAALAGTPIGWGKIEAGAQFPRVVLNRVSGTRDHTLKGKGLMHARLQVDCYAEDYTEAHGLSQTVCATLERFSSGPVQGTFLESMRDGIEGDPTTLHRISLTFRVHYTENLPG